jgi:type II restriction enzyme
VVQIFARAKKSMINFFYHNFNDWIMQLVDLLQLYEQMKVRYGTNTYKHISELLKEAKQIHRKDFLESPSVRRRLQNGRIPDHEHSWRAFKGKNLENLIMAITKDEVESLGLFI